MYGGFEYCTYITPCGYCSKFDKWCEEKCGKKDKENNITISNNPNDPINQKVNIEELIRRGFNESKGELKDWKLNRGMF